MQRRSVIRHAGSMLAGSALLATPFIGRPARAASTWTAFSAQPPGSASVRGLKRLAEQLTTATAGAFSLQVRPLGTLGVNVANLVHAVATGAADLAEDPFYSSPVPAGGLVRLPMLVNSASDYQRAAAALRPYLQSALTERDVMFLGSTRPAAQSLWSRRRLDSLYDIAGQRVRPATPEQAELVRRYGGVPVTLAATEVAGALHSGVINAMFATASTAGNTKPEPWKSSLVAGYTGYQGYADTAFIANPQAFASLGTETQALLTRAMEDASAWIAATRDAEEAAAREELRNSGVKIAEGTAEELVIARIKLAPYWGSWAVPRGRDAMDQLAIMRKTLER